MTKEVYLIPDEVAERTAATLENIVAQLKADVIPTSLLDMTALFTPAEQGQFKITRSNASFYFLDACYAASFEQTFPEFCAGSRQWAKVTKPATVDRLCEKRLRLKKASN